MARHKHNSERHFGRGLCPHKQGGKRVRQLLCSIIAYDDEAGRQVCRLNKLL